jgi:hypothetical protein
MTLRRQISDAEKEAVLAQQGMRCFIDNHPIDDPADVEFDHIRPFAESGDTDISNIGATCRKHNREKSSMSLSEYRDRLGIRRFFEGATKRRLDDLLSDRLGPKGYGQPVQVEIAHGSALIYLDEKPIQTSVSVDPATSETYFYASLPFRVLRNDAELQPRALEPDRVWELYRHLRNHTQLAPAVCRLVADDLLLFDGQHKAAAQIWAGRNAVDCKVYVEPDVRRLKDTNLAAHDKLRQMPFYTSTLLEKYAAMAREDWEAFLLGGGPKTETTFVEFLRIAHQMSRAEATKRVRSMIVQDIIEHGDNGLREYIAEENRSRANPLSMSRLGKTFFAEFIAPPPLNDEFESDGYHRDEERANVVRLFNLVVELALRDKWAPERDDEDHRRSVRQFSAGSLRAWVPFLRDAIAAGLQLFDQEDRSKVLYRSLSEEDFKVIRLLATRLFSHKVWDDLSPELNDLRYDNADRAKDMLRRFGLTTNWLLGGAS